MLLTLFAVLAAALAACAIITAVQAPRIAAAYPPVGRFVPVAGGRMHVLELGAVDDAHPPVVLLHGASGNLNDMRVLGDRLARSHRVILIDRPGHGYSDRIGGDEAASPGRQAELVAATLDAMGVPRAIVLAHSLAGAVGTALALNFPDKLSGLVLLSAVTHPWSGGMAWYNNLVTTRLVGGLAAHTIVLPLGSLMIESAAPTVFLPQLMPPHYVESTSAKLLFRPAEFIANAQDLAVLKDFVRGQVSRYGGITMPVTIITGDADPVVYPDVHSRALKRALPSAKLVMLPGVGHMPHYAATERVAAEVDEMAAGLQTAR